MVKSGDVSRVAHVLTRPVSAQVTSDRSRDGVVGRGGGGCMQAFGCVLFCVFVCVRSFLLSEYL